MPQVLENPPPAPPRAAARSHRWIWLGLLAAALAGGGGFWYWKAHRTTGGPPPAEESKTPGPVAVEAVLPQRGGLERNCVQPGSLERYEGADIYAKVSGFLAEQRVDIGSPVKRGQVLAKISVPEFDKLVQRDKADVAHAQARVRQLRARVTSAQAEAKAAVSMIALSEAQMKSKTAYRVFRKEQLERMTELLAQKAIDARLVDESENNYQAAVGAEDAAREAIATARLKADAAAANIQSAEADLDEAKAQVMVSEAELGQAQVMLDYTTIISDYDGVVTRRSFNRGDFVRSADAGGDRIPLLSVERTDKFRVVVEVPDPDVPFVEVGAKALVKIDSLPGRTIEATVSRKATRQDPGTRNMRTEIDVPNPDGKLQSGMYGQATIVLQIARPDSLTVPSTAVEGRTRDFRGTLRIVRGGTVHIQPVTTGADNGIRVEILSGLNPDDRVVIRANGAIAEGTPVTISGASTPGH